jgi:hypothetical protein
MRKLSISITLFLLILQAAHAQNQKGNQTLGIGLQFNTGSTNYNFLSINSSITNSEVQQSTGFSATPSYSYFIANNLDLGVSVGFGSGSSNLNDNSSNTIIKQIDKNYSVSLYMRRYILYKNKIGIRTGPYFSYQYFDSNYTDITNNVQSIYTKGNNYQAGIIADFVYYPSSKIGLAVNLGNLSYNNGKTSSQQQSSSASGLNLQFLSNNLMLSAFYVFGK